MEQLHGTLTTYEMRIGGNKIEPKEVTSKFIKNHTKNRGHQDFSSCDLNEEMAQFVRKFKRDSGKYKSKLPFNCFDYGRVGNFASKFPYTKAEKQENEKEKEKIIEIELRNIKRRKLKEKNFCTMEDIESFEIKN